MALAPPYHYEESAAGDDIAPGPAGLTAPLAPPPSSPATPYQPEESAAGGAEALSEPNWADATLDWALYEPHWSPGASSATMASGPAFSGALYFQVEPGEVDDALPSRSILDSQGRLKHSERQRRQRARNALARR